MICGGVFSTFFSRVAAATPYLIATMLFVTYCRLSLREVKFARLHLWMLLIQFAGSVAVYGMFCWANELLAQGLLICILAPTAVAAAVVTGMLGGNVPYIAAFTLLSNLCVAFLSPLIFSWIGARGDMPFWTSVWEICRQVAPLLLLPLAAAWALDRVAPRAHRFVREHQSISFYLWTVALATVVGKTVFFVRAQDSSHYWEETTLAAAALAVCVLQFVAGDRLGRRVGLPVAGAQGLGQKNTILAVWMAQVYLSPLCSVAPAAYVLWQNLINSWQLWRKRRKETAR